MVRYMNEQLAPSGGKPSPPSSWSWHHSRMNMELPAKKQDGRATLAISGCSNNNLIERVIHNPAPMGFDPDCSSGMMPCMNKQPSGGKPNPPLSSSWHQARMNMELPSKELKRPVEKPFVHSSSKPAELSGPEGERRHQNKEFGHHITSTPHGKHDMSHRTQRTKRRAGRYEGLHSSLINGELSKYDNGQDYLSSEEQLPKAVQSESALAKHGHSDLVNGERIIPVIEGTVAVLNPQQQIASNDKVVMGPSLPFLETVAVWEAVESLEIFQKLPQQPHFLPLVNEKERFREGLAIATLVTFANTAESTAHLSIDDDVDSLTDCLETLQTLESYGFDIEILKCHLMKLLWLKKMHQEIDEDKSNLKGQISDLKNETVEVEEEIFRTAENIKFYEDKIISASLKEEEKGLEVLALEIRLDVLNKVIRHAHLDF